MTPDEHLVGVEPEADGLDLRSLDTTQLPLAARYLTGRAFAQSDPRVMQVGWAVIRRAVLAVRL